MTNQTLLRAADVIAANGFIQGDYVEGAVPGRPAATCPVCPRGAIAIAADQHPLFAVDWPDYCDGADGDDEEPEPDDEEPGTAAERTARTLIKTAEALFARYLREELDYRQANCSDQVLIERWADEDERAQPEVVGALRAAAEYTGRPA